MVHPGYPRVRLAPPTIDAFGLERDPMSVVLSDLDKRYLHLAPEHEAQNWRFVSTRRRLRAVYALERRPDLDRPIIEPARGADRLMTLLKYVSAKFAPLNRTAQAHELEQLGKLAATVPVRKIRCPDGFEHLPELCELLIDDLAACLH
jgi:hypothetical protein